MSLRHHAISGPQYTEDHVTIFGVDRDSHFTLFTNWETTMRTSNSFAHHRRLDDTTRSLLTDSIRGRGASPFSRRDLLRAGAAGLVGLGLPLIAPPRARADGVCQPQDGSNVLWANSIPRTDVNVVANGNDPAYPFLKGDQLCVWVQNNLNSDVVLVWDVFDAPNANTTTAGCSSDGGLIDNGFHQGQVLISISFCTVPAGAGTNGQAPFKCCTTVPSTCIQGDISRKQGDHGFYPKDLVLQNPALLLQPVALDPNSFLGTFLLGGPCQPCCIRMTGGGGTIPAVGGGQVETQQGFQLRSGPGAHSNLELHWTTPDGTLHNFHAGPDDFSDLRCGFDKSCSGGQPLDQPNMIAGQINGTLDGQAATVFLNFVDCGEPGTNDKRTIGIFVQQGNFQVPVVLAQGKISNGNNQAHKCNGN